MTPLMVKGTLFGLLLLSAAVWDMRNREIPNLIPALLLLCGLIGFRPAASVAGLIQAVLSLSLAALVGLVECRLQKQPLSAVRLPLAPFFCFGGVSAYWLTAFALQI